MRYGSLAWPGSPARYCTCLRVAGSCRGRVTEMGTRIRYPEDPGYPITIRLMGQGWGRLGQGWGHRLGWGHSAEWVIAGQGGYRYPQAGYPWSYE